MTITPVLVFILMSMFYVASCKGNKGSSYIENLSYDGTNITWNSVKNAKNYKYSIDNGIEQIVSQAETKIEVKYNSNGENFEFFVEAVIKDGSDKNPKYTITFENLGQVSNLKIEEGLLKWDIIGEADKYQVMYNGDIVAASVGSNYYETTEGSFNYKVKAIKTNVQIVNGNNPYYSTWSEVITGKILETPVNLKYDSETLTWDKVNGATSYKIKIDSEEFNTTTNKFDFNAGAKDFDIYICAIGNENEKIYNSAYSEKKTYQYIETITSLNVTDGKLTWSAPVNASRYKIKINGVIQDEEVTTNEYTQLASGTSYRIQVLPIATSDFYFSHWSNEVTINLLRSPVVNYSDGVIRWNQVSGSSGYELKIEKDNQVVHTTTVGEEVFVYDYAFETAGKYSVYVKATTLGTGGVYDSKYSIPYSVTRLSAPTNQQIINRPLEQNQVSITFNPCLNATGYKLLADDIQVASITSGTTFSVDLTKMTSKLNESIVNFKIVALGGITTLGSVLDTLTPLEFTITKLATPQNLMISGTQLSWDSVANTSKYVLTIDGVRTEVTTASYTITDISAGTHSIYVQAMGNGEEVITGSFSNELEVRKLAVPSNLVISNGLLSWETISSARAYKVVLGTDTYNADTTQFDLLGYESYISEGVGTQVSVYAIGNGTDVIDSDVSATKTFSKYSRPTNIKVSGDNLIWNTSSVNSINCNSYKLSISKNGGIVDYVTITGNSYSISNFGPGEYTVSVLAVGDYVATIDSPASNPFSFTRLESISSISKENGIYSWSNILGATGYEIKLSKDATWTSIVTNSYKPIFTTEGQFEVSIRVIGNGDNTIDSDVYSFTQTVSRITQPVQDNTLNNSNAFKIETSGNTITITMKKVNGASGYKLIVGGIERDNILSDTETEISYSFIMTTVNATYKIQVQVLGNEFNDNGVYILDSNISIEVPVIYQS